MEFTNEQLKQIAQGMIANAAKHPESVCAAADKRLYELALERLAQLDKPEPSPSRVCHHHPDIPMRVNPFVVLTSYPPRPVYYCPVCDPITAAREAEHNELKGRGV